MRDLLYVPPGRTEPSGAIGLLMPEFGNPVFAALAQAMETRATAAGFSTIICNTAGSAMREVDYVHMLLERRVEGMVFVCARDHGCPRGAVACAQLLDGRPARLRERVLGVAAGDVGRGRRARVGPHGHRASAGARPPPDRLRRGRGVRARDPGQGAGARGGARSPRPRPRRRRRLRRVLGRRSTARAPPDHRRGERRRADRRHLLQRPDGDRGDAGGGRARAPRPGRSFDRRLRRDRCGGLDTAAAHDDRTADRRDRRNRDRGDAGARRRARADAPELRLPPHAPCRRNDGGSPLAKREPAKPNPAARSPPAAGHIPEGVAFAAATASVDDRGPQAGAQALAMSNRSSNGS